MVDCKGYGEFQEFYNAFTQDLKLGMHGGPTHHIEITHLLQYNAIEYADEMASFDNGMSHVNRDQQNICYMVGNSELELEKSWMMRTPWWRSIKSLNRCCAGQLLDVGIATHSSIQN